MGLNQSAKGIHSRQPAYSTHAYKLNNVLLFVNFLYGKGLFYLQIKTIFGSEKGMDHFAMNNINSEKEIG